MKEEEIIFDDDMPKDIDYSQNADAIQTLSERNKIRTKIAVYAGDATITGFHVLLREPIDNAIDEFSFHKENIKDTKFDTIKITIDTKRKRAKVRDYGRGIPYVKDKSGMSTLEKTLTILHAGGKHHNNANHLLSENLGENKSQYSFSSGINGIGITLTNFASNLFQAVVYNEKMNEKAYMTFKDGYIEHEATITKLQNSLDFLDEEDNKDLKTGTLIIYEPSIKLNDFDDDNVFENDVNFDKEIITKQLKILPYLNPGLTIKLIYDGEEIIFKKEQQFSSILKKENVSKLILEKKELDAEVEEKIKRVLENYKETLDYLIS